MFTDFDCVVCSRNTERYNMLVCIITYSCIIVSIKISNIKISHFGFVRIGRCDILNCLNCFNIEGVVKENYI